MPFAPRRSSTRKLLPGGAIGSLSRVPKFQLRWSRRQAASATREAVRRHIDELPESFRTVLLLRDIEGLSTEETARLLETTPNAVKIRLHRARQALRTLLAPHFRRGEL